MKEGGDGYATGIVQITTMHKMSLDGWNEGMAVTKLVPAYYHCFKLPVV